MRHLRGTRITNIDTRIVWEVRGETMVCIVPDKYGTWKVGDAINSDGAHDRKEWVITPPFVLYLKLVR
jgi:hypothetical protein